MRWAAHSNNIGSRCVGKKQCVPSGVTVQVVWLSCVDGNMGNALFFSVASRQGAVFFGRWQQVNTQRVISVSTTRWIAHTLLVVVAHRGPGYTLLVENRWQ